MNGHASVEWRWIRVGIFMGLAASVIYPVIVFISLPRFATVLLAASVGPAVGISSLGLSRLLRAHVRTVSAELAAVCNLTAGAIFTLMLLVQLAVRLKAGGRPIDQSVVAVWLGLDVAWDIFIGLGTALFASAMWKHPRFGPGFAASGLIIAALLLGFNLATFPVPPANARLVDVGPLVGVWYLAVTIQAWRSLGWARKALGLDAG